MDDGRQGFLNSVYFEPDTAVLIESFRPVLEHVGRQLAANSALHLHIQAYAAPFRTAGGQMQVSWDRARFVQNYFIQNYGIAANRITAEAFGAERIPARATAEWQSHRCAELILIEN